MGHNDPQTKECVRFRLVAGIVDAASVHRRPDIHDSYKHWKRCHDPEESYIYPIADGTQIVRLRASSRSDRVFPNTRITTQLLISATDSPLDSTLDLQAAYKLKQYPHAIPYQLQIPPSQAVAALFGMRAARAELPESTVAHRISRTPAQSQTLEVYTLWLLGPSAPRRIRCCYSIHQIHYHTS